MSNTHPRLRKSTKIDPEIMAGSLEANTTAHEQDALLRDEDERDSNGQNSTELRDINHPKSKRALFLGNSVHVVKITLGCSYSNLLLPFVFLGIISGSLGWDDSLSFLFNFLAILPLAALLSFATEELAKSVGQTIGGLINATFGNAVEMIVGITAVRQGEISIVQSSMVGSILSGNLLVLGVSLFCDGYAKDIVKFNVDVSGILSSLMVVSSATLIIPSVLYSTIPSKSQEVEASVLSLSRAASVVLLTFYLVYLYFQLKSHSELFVDDTQVDEEEERVLGPWSASIILVLATLGVTVCSDRLVDSVDGFVDKWHVSRAFIGLIVVPIVGNAGEFNTVINSSIKGNMDLAIGVIVGSTLQIALFVSPFLVMCGWIIGQPMSLRYSPFETVVFFLSVIVMDCLIRGGRSNYYEGSLLVGTYLIIAIAFYVHPDAVDAPFV
ncbi:hypothetical protein N7447_009825 [Penicillium robsamsonii]|uniref:uncharacterized protein n=1 Tax=Penicillium robsamsonii TaxID=1792511 RepID=UPI00254689AA|nr:uncharacterized protein N7447_009825 [Penicillium robsamsonii]KAJ5812802.1 hypothetical protein N7447_009825 [Penicillium robsamsonii]